MSRRMGVFRSGLAAGVALAAILLAQPVLSMETEDVRVRYGRHADYVRLVFDWKADTPYNVVLEPKGALITFEASNGFDFSRVEGLQRLAARAVEGGVRVRYDRAVSLKHFRHGSRIVIDFYETEAGDLLPDAKAVATAQAAAAEAARAQAAEAAAAPEPTYPPAPRRRDGGPASTENATSAPSKAPPAVTSTPTDAEAVAAKAMAAMAPPPKGKPEPPTSAVEPTTNSNTSPAVADPTANDPITPPATAAAPTIGPPSLSDIPPETLRGTAISSAPPIIEPVSKLTVEQRDGTIVLGLGAGDMRAASYSRAGGHWIVLDTPLDVDFADAHAIGLDALQLPFPDKTVVYIDAGATPHLSAWKDERGWRFGLSADRLTAQSTPMPVDRRTGGESGARFVLDRLEDAKLVRVIDPEVGDSLFVAVVANAQHVAEGFDSPDASVLATALGVVIEPKTEGVSVRVSEEALEVRKRGGLRFSDPNRLLLGSENVRPTAVDLKAWRGDDADYISGVMTRLAGMNGVADFGRNAYRLDLARYSLARGYPAEAVGYLQSVVQSDKGAAERTEIRMLRGIARAMLGQHDLAALDLDHEALVGDPNVEIWRALAMAEREEHRFASAKFHRYWDAVAEWPPRYRARLTVAAGEASLAAGLPGVAERFLQQDGPNLAPSLMELAGNAIVAGKIKMGRGDFEGAKSDFNHAKNKGDAETYAKAELALIQLGYSHGEVDADAASERLRQLQLSWRGDRIEFETLKTWGEIRLEQSQFREGFWALHEASFFYGERFDTSDLRATMTAGFAHAFVDGGADELPALEAVALFEDFRTLAPPGARGDLALANFARRLIELDLVDEADELLDHLVRHRLKAEPRVDAAADLARLRISRRQWTDAISTLDQVVETVADQERVDRNLRLKAEALSGLGRTGDALELLKGSQDIKALWLRADMAWRSADWITARQAYRELDTIGALGGGALDDRQAATVLRWAVSAHLLKNGDEVAEISRQFADQVQNKSLSSALKALATPTLGGEANALAAARIAIENADKLAKSVEGYASKSAQAG